MDIRSAPTGAERRTCDISVTLNTYMHVGFGDAQEEMRRVAEA